MQQSMNKVRPHRVLSRIDNEVHALSLKEGPHAGIIFSYEKVSLDEDAENDVAKLNFEYNVHFEPEGLQYEKEALEKELGDFLIELIVYGIEQHNLGYLNDENREDDPIKPDPQ